MALERATSGMILARCPNGECGLLHLVKRNRDYKAKEQVRFRCTGCKTSWYATEQERKTIADAYSQPPKRGKKSADLHPPPQEESSWWNRIFE